MSIALGPRVAVKAVLELEAMKDILITTRMARRVSESSQNVKWTAAISKRPIILPDVKEVPVYFPNVRHVPPDYAVTGQEAEIGCIPACRGKSRLAV